MTTTRASRLGLSAAAALLVVSGTAAAPPPAGPEHWHDALVGPRLAGLGDSRPLPRETVIVRTAEALRTAIAGARPGTVIELQPGTYEFSGVGIEAARPGLADLPIVVRAAALGTVRLRFALLEGFHVVAPYWTFENLVVEGVCPDDHDCEHAFHVVGDAVGTVIQNNWVTDFNAAVKVNGRDGRYPDDGLIRHNAFLNAWPRDTDRPVTVLDIVSVSRWRVQRNFIADFAKKGGNRTSYGAFFKGAGEDNLFEQNLVLCEQRHAGQRRVGFSFGGSTGRRFCRDGSCSVEHRRGIARNNVIMHCPNAAGIDLNKSADTLVHNNALIGTRGIGLRRAGTDAEIVNNIVDGRIWARDGAVFTAAGNIVAPGVSGEVYRDAAAGDLRLKNGQAVLGRGVPLAGGGLDLCGQPTGAATPDIGPVQYSAASGCVPALW